MLTSGWRLVAVWGLLWNVCSPVSAQQGVPAIEYLGAASIPGDARDFSGETATLENGEAVNRLGGFSAIDYSGSGTMYALLSDRGPDDGAVSYPCRVQLVNVVIDPTAQEPIRVTLERTIPLVDLKKRPFTGRSTILEATERFAHRLDPEGFRFGPQQTMYISDEYGPEILQFDRDGHELRRIAVPAWYRVAVGSGDRQEENSRNRAGRASNRGLECLALSADGASLAGLMQGPLIQDGVKNADNTRVTGRVCRLVKIQLATGAIEEYVYELDSDEHGNSEILSMPDGRFLVLERDSEAGEGARFRKLIAIDLTGATNVHGRVTLMESDMKQSVKPVQKTVFLDLLDPMWPLAGKSMPEKIEGITFGPALPDGRQTLLVGTDNDFESAAASKIWVFAIQQSR